MRNKLFTLLLAAAAAFCTAHAYAQVTENFADGDFTNNPVWTGNTADWMVNSASQLQSNNTVANASFYLATANTKAVSVQWEFFVQLAFSTSGSNYVDVYLTASAADLTQSATSGYFVRLGNTLDEISLYRKDPNGTSTKIIDGADASIAGSNNQVRVKVIRDAANKFTLYRDVTGGTNYFNEGTVTDATYTSSAWFGILVKQSTSSFFQKHFFDDILVTDYVPDLTPPAIVSATATAANTIDLLFSEAVEKTSAEDLTNYHVAGIGKPVTATRNSANSALVTLVFAGNFTSGTAYTLSVTNISDLSGNMLTSSSAGFNWFLIGMYSIVIDEIMADPTPQVGLPNAEWIELKNTTPVPINLQGYRLGKSTGVSGPMPSFVLQPDSFVVITTASQVPALSAFGKTISVTSFPSLGNEGDYIFLQNASSDLMHFVSYSSDWYQNNVKADGGWSLEMIDPSNPCSGASNWRASVDAKGGTPGKINSINAANKDKEAPRLLRAFAADANTIALFFNEPLDAVTAGNAANYSVSDGIGQPTTAVTDNTSFSKVTLTVTNAIQAGKIYTVTVNAVADCIGNTVAAQSSARLGLASPADSLDLVINEILFDPKPTGVDYLELYNRSNKIIDLSGISLANRSSTTGNIGTPVKLSADNYLLFPGEYILLSPEPATTARDYLVKYPDVVITLPLPSFSDTRGAALILNKQGAIVDELDYDYKWHSPLVDDAEGVSLERIDFNRPTNDAGNWTSAAATAGYGTPGYANSQYRADLTPQGEIVMNPKIFSPDNDGYDDFTLIEFKFPEPGYIANITIFDAAGSPVKLLQRNTSCAARGAFRWDGTNDKLQKVGIGTYVIFTEIFNLKGQKKQFKNTVVVARKLN